MKPAPLVLWLAALASAFQAQAPGPASQPAPAPSAAPATPSAPAVEPYAGSLREGRVELQRLSEAAQHEQAATLAASVLAKPDFEQASDTERAEFWFAAGVARGAAMAFDEAAEASHASRGLAGSSELGLAAAYNAGTFRLMLAEQARTQIPELREKLQLPPLTPPNAGAPGAGAADQAPDPLQLARAAYLAARADLVERWRADPRHVDTRANLELVQRRLRELDELERQREQQEQEQQQDQQQNQQQDPNQKQDPQQDPQQNEQQNEQQNPEQDPSQQDPSQQDPPKDEQEPKDPKSEDQPKPEGEDEQQPQDPQSQDQADPAQPQDERTLTPEEVQRLLQQLEKIDEQAQQVQAALRRARRTPVKKDW